MPTFTYRPLSGFYKGSFANQLSDYTKINNSFLELSKDIPSLDARLHVLEANGVGIFSTGNFEINSIQGSILADGSVPGNKITNNSITGDQIVLNSVHGLTDANISSAANISASKINLGEIDHELLENVGSHTHPQIDTDLNQLFHDVGSSEGAPLSVPLDSRVTANAAQIVSLQGSLSTLNSYVNPGALSTTAQTVSAAINEIVVDLQEVGASGLGVAGPVTSTIGAVALWNSTTGKLLKNSSIVNTATETTFPSNLELTGPGFHLATAGTPFTSVNTINLHMQNGADGGSIYGSGVGLTLLPGDTFESTNFVNATGTDTFNVSGLVMDTNHTLYARAISAKPGSHIDINSDATHDINITAGGAVRFGGQAVFGQGTGASIINNNNSGFFVDNTDAVGILNHEQLGYRILSGNSGLEIRTSGQPIDITALGADGLASGGEITISTSGANIDLVTGFGTLTLNDSQISWLNGTDTFEVDHTQMLWYNGQSVSIHNNDHVVYNNGTATMIADDLQFFWNNGPSTLIASDSELLWGNGVGRDFHASDNLYWNNGTSFVNISDTGSFITSPSGYLIIGESIIHRTQDIPNHVSGGNIGAADNTVDIDSGFLITQSTAAQTLFLPSPTVTNSGRIAYVNNLGPQSFTMLGKVVPSGAGLTAMWTGTRWSLIGFGG